MVETTDKLLVLHFVNFNVMYNLYLLLLSAFSVFQLLLLL